jgi:hypothetical protein
VKQWGRGVAVLCCALLIPGTAWADVVPPRREKSDRDARRVENRLASLGVTPAVARTSADQLTSAELSFFAEDSSRIQAVGGLTAGEWLAGAAFLGLLAFLYFAFVSNQ